MSNIVEAPSPKELLVELRDEAKILPKDSTDLMLRETRRYLARWMRSLHSKKDLGGSWEISKEDYGLRNRRFALNYSLRRIDTVAIVKPREH